jgi:hypothetical protein
MRAARCGSLEYREGSPNEKGAPAWALTPRKAQAVAQPLEPVFIREGENGFLFFKSLA